MTKKEPDLLDVISGQLPRKRRLTIFDFGVTEGREVQDGTGEEPVEELPGTYMQALRGPRGGLGHDHADLCR